MKNSNLGVIKAILVSVFAIVTSLSPVLAITPDLKEKISITVKNMSMQQFFAEIENRSSYTFFYSNTVLKGVPDVSVSVQDMAIDQLLHQVFKGTNLVFEEVGNKIAIKMSRAATNISGGGKTVTTSEPEVKQSKAQPSEASQSQWVTGTVLDEDGKPMVGVGVIIVSTLNGVTTDINGKYRIQAKPEQELHFSFLGYKDHIVKVGNRSVIDVSMITEGQALDAVIVTALGIKREEKSLGYAAEKIDGEVLASATNSENWLSGLAGQVAGLNIDQANSAGGGTTRVTLRGESSADFENNAALFVVDGVPMFNTFTMSDSGGEGSAYAIDYGNGTGDLNPDDIATVSVLKGPAATALYGSAAANGAIVITTKNADNLSGKLSITYSTNVSFRTVNTEPDLQYVYGQGDRSDYYYYNMRSVDSGKGGNYDPMPSYSNTSNLWSWGPKMDGTLYYQYYNASQGIGGSYDALGEFRREATPFVSLGNWFNDFFDTGYTISNSVTVSGKINNRNSVRISLRDNHSSSIVPNSPSDNQHLFITTRNEFTKWLTSDISLNYRRDHRDNIPVSSGYGANSIMYSLWCYAPNVDMDWVKNYWLEGKEGTNQDSTLSGGKNNTAFIVNESVNTQDRNRIYGNVKLDFKIYKGLTLMVRGGLDFTSDYRTQQTASSSQADPQGFYRIQRVVSQQYSGEFLFRYNHNFRRDIKITANFGGSIVNRQNDTNAQWADNLKNPGVYTLANSASLVKCNNNYYHRQVNSLYGMMQFSWRNSLFLDVTGRNDWSSTLPAANRSYFYPSVSASAVLNELFNFGSKGGIINLMKVRASWAHVGHDTAPYRVDQYLSNTNFPGNVTIPSSKANDTLKPEKVSSWEVGADIRMLRNRLKLDLTYYNSLTTNALGSMPVSNITGMSGIYTNTGTFRNQGIEIAASATILRTRNIRWTINANWSMNRNKVISLGENTDYWQLGGYSSYAYMYASEGSTLTGLYGYSYLRAPDGSYAVDADGRKINVSGQIVHSKEGVPLIDNNISYLGDAMPKWKAGIGTSFSWNGLKATVRFDGKYGGKVWSLTNWVMNFRGKGNATLEGREGGFVPEGVILLDDGNYKICDVVHTPETIQSYYQAKYNRSNTEANIVETSFIKLREVRLDYTFPKKLLSKTKIIHELKIAVFGTNLYCWDKYPGFDPEAVSIRGAAMSPGFDLLQLPGCATYGGSLAVTF